MSGKEIADIMMGIICIVLLYSAVLHKDGWAK